MALGLLSWLFILRFEKYNRNSDILFFAIINSAGIYAHYFYIFVGLAQYLYFTIVHRHDNFKIRKFYLAFLCSWLLFSPWFIPVSLKGYKFLNTEWIFGYPGVFDKICYLAKGLVRYILIFDSIGKLQYALVLVAALLYIYMAAVAIKDMSVKYPGQFLFCLIMFLVPMACMFLIDIIENGALLRQGRFWMFSFLGFIPFVGYFLNYSFTKNRLLVYSFILLILVSSFTVSNTQFGPAPKYTSGWINRESADRNTAVIICNIRSVVFAQAYYLDDRIYLIPLSDNRQFMRAVSTVSSSLDKIFIARHYHRTDPSLMDKSFMGTRNVNFGFSFKTTFRRDDIEVSEFEKCAF